jgi:hypothetical protein
MSKLIDPTEMKMSNMMVIIDTALAMTENHNDQLMLACAMLQRTTEIFDHILTVDGRKKMFKDLCKDV